MNTLLRCIFFAAFLFLQHIVVLAQWTQIGSGMSQVWDIVIDPTNEQIMYAGSNTTGMWKTTNGGTSWVQINGGLSSTVVQAVAISRTSPDILFCGTNAGIFLTVDGGASWFAINGGITENPIGVQAIAVDPTTSEIAYIAIFDGAANAVNGIYRTTDNGVTWIPAATGIGAVKNFLSFAINPLNPKVLYAGSSFNTPAGGTEQSRIYKSTNGAASWFDVSNGLPATQGNTTHNPIRKLSIQAIDTNRVLAGIFLNDSLGGVYLTTDGGGSWAKRHTGLPTLAPGTLPRSILIRPGSTTEFYVGIGTEQGVFRSTNAGLSWESFNNGALSSPATIRALVFAPNSSRLFAGGAHASDLTLQGVFRSQLTPLSVLIHPSGIPDAIVLYQNYPNPFNPTTKIAYGLPERKNVILRVYNVLGQEVATLVDNDMSPGYHEATFDGTGLTSGMYFYRLQTGSYVETKRLILMK